MTDREKLVELLDDISYEQELSDYDLWDMREAAELIADFLIAKGVTVREWISVKDRLPEDSAEVNVFTRSRIVGSGYYDKYTKRWVQYAAGGAIYVDVTHWQSLPEAQKEG